MEEKNLNKQTKQITFNLLEIIIIILMTTLVVAVSTGIIVYKNYGKLENTGLSYIKANYFNEFESAYNRILNNYVENVDEKDLINAAIQGMYNYLGDPYTGYLDEELSDDLTDRLNGYKGIGVEITKIEEGILVVNSFKDGPAYKAGLESGDIITKINGKDVTKSTAADAQNMIKNSKKDQIEISFFRGGITKTIEINITNVSVPTIESNIYEGVGYIKISSFANNTPEEFEKALKSLEEKEINNLIIDVRNNGGGYLNAATEIAELFIEKGIKEI